MKLAPWLAGAVLLLARPALARDINDVLTNLDKADQAVKTIRFDFVQDIKFLQMNSASVVSGEAIFSRPNRLRIEKKKPDEQVTVSNGKKLWVYNPAFKQVWTGSWQSWIKAKAIPPGLVPVGGYVADLRKNFNLSLGADEGATVHVIAQPKVKEIGYSLEIVVSTETWMPVQTVFKSETAVISTVLSGTNVNPKIADSVFQFKAPPGVDVIPLN